MVAGPCGYHPITMSHSAEPDDEPRDPPRRWGIPIAVLIALASLGIAAWALVRPILAAAPPPTPQQIADAKGKACAAYSTVRAAVALQTHVEAPADPVAAQAVAANARLAMAVGSQHLLENLGPDVPRELADPMRAVADELRTLTMHALAGAPDDDPAQVGALREIEAKSQTISGLCSS